MGYRYTKLFEQILDSTIWCEPDSTRVVWITMLAMADRDGLVLAAVPGLAKRANVALEACEAALERFQQPDKHSRTPDHEGRRIERVQGGWRLLNHAKYRELLGSEAERARKRDWWNKNKGKPSSTRRSSENSTELAQASTEASTTKSSSLERTGKATPNPVNTPPAAMSAEEKLASGIAPMPESLKPKRFNGEGAT